MLRLIRGKKVIFQGHQTLCFCTLECMLACSVASVMPNSMRPYGLYPTRLLCPWDSPGKNTGVDCDFHLQDIFPTQGLNPSLLYCRWISLPLSYQRRPLVPLGENKFGALTCVVGDYLSPASRFRCRSLCKVEKDTEYQKMLKKIDGLISDN